jgi:uncharacterized protein YndB with AHSA1/START domain
MGKTTVNAPIDKVFEAVSDLTRHADWAAHAISITAETEGPVMIGHTYSSGKSGNKLGRLQVTELEPNDHFRFQVVMPNGWELDWAITPMANGEGAEVDRKVKVTKMPTYMKPALLAIAMVGSIFVRKMAKKMKADIEGGG